MKFSDLFRVDWFSVIAEGKMGHLLKLSAVVVFWDFPRMALIWILTEVRLVFAYVGAAITVVGRLTLHFAGVVIPRWQQQIASAKWKE
jgi:hypothetical protein